VTTTGAGAGFSGDFIFGDPPLAPTNSTATGHASAPPDSSPNGAGEMANSHPGTSGDAFVFHSPAEPEAIQGHAPAAGGSGVAHSQFWSFIELMSHAQQHDADAIIANEVPGAVPMGVTMAQFDNHAGDFHFM